METQYCEKCGLLHDPDDGECLGCAMQKEIDDLKKRIELKNKEIVSLQLIVCGQCIHENEDGDCQSECGCFNYHNFKNKLEKQIKEKDEQIERMKVCENCKYFMSYESIDASENCLKCKQPFSGSIYWEFNEGE